MQPVNARAVAGPAGGASTGCWPGEAGRGGETSKMQRAESGEQISLSYY
jgi:hypothetical protein